ncbi:MAG: hypothetical protein ABI240_09895 [Sphingomonas sp.]
MCDPITLMVAATVAKTAGSVVSGIGQKQVLDYQAQVADQNSKLAEDQAQDSIQNTNLEAQRRYRDLAQTKGRQVAAMAANGIDLSFGSAGDLQRDTAATGAEDLAQLYKGGNERTRGFEINAFNARAEAAGDRAKGKGALTDGIFGGFATALGGAASVAKMANGS